ncbi:MAG TPA: ABC transporter substrate-binding protein [Acidimicrobiales bacterium]|jgi:branched-chain amino acid transport system substrate-binding protein|nr:ABC transporter substrate-binding protein [Acidimicrobiales bacterium]
MKLRNGRIVTCGLALAVGVGTLAVGATSATAAATAAATPGVTAKTITVGSISDISAPIPGLFKGAKVGAQAYFNYINSQGGVNGRKIILDARDSAFSSGTVASEAQSIAKSDFAFVGGYSLLDGAEQPAIDANKVPMIAQALTPSLFKDPNLYSAIPLVDGGEANGPFKWLKSQYPAGVKAVGFIGSNATASVKASEATYRALTYNLGYKWVYTRDAGYTETSFLADMVKMKSAGVKMVLEVTEGPAEISTMAQEIKQQGLNAPLVVGAGTYSKAFDPGSAGNGTLLYTVTSLYMGEDAAVIPAVGTFDKWVKKTDPNPTLDLFTLDGWINAQLFVQALKLAGANPTRASLVAQLNKINSFNASGLISSQNPAQKIPGQCWIAAKYTNGKWLRIKPDPKAAFVCNPKGFFPASYKGISR